MTSGGLTSAAARAVRSAPGIAVSVWVAAYVLIAATGQGYSVRVLWAGYQFLPFEELSRRPLASTWYLHTQPPGWNLLIGAVARWSPFPVAATLQAVTVATGAVLAWAIAGTLVRLGAGRAMAVVITAIATLNTQVLSHAFEPRYDFAVAAALAVLVRSLARRPDPRPVSLVAPAAIGTVVVMTRTLYHPLWLAFVLGLVAWCWRGRLDGRRLAIAVALPVVAVGAWVVKNEVQVDRPTLSTWTGMNLLRSVAPAVPASDLAELRRDGVISGVATVPPFAPFDAYETYVEPCDPPTGPSVRRIESRPIPEAQRTGPFDGATAPNFNFECYLAVYDAARDDAIAIARARPGAWLRARAWSANNWFEVVQRNHADDSALFRLVEDVTSVVLVAVPHPGLPDAWADSPIWVHETPQSVVLPVLTVVVLAAGVWSVLRLRRRRAADEGDDGADDGTDDGPDDGVRARAAVLAVAALTVAWTIGAGVVLELGEQSRFRNATDPLVMALGSFLVVSALTRWRRRRVDGAVDDT